MGWLRITFWSEWIEVDCWLHCKQSCVLPYTTKINRWWQNNLTSTSTLVGCTKSIWRVVRLAVANVKPLLSSLKRPKTVVCRESVIISTSKQCVRVCKARYIRALAAVHDLSRNEEVTSESQDNNCVLRGASSVWITEPEHRLQRDYWWTTKRVLYSQIKYLRISYWSTRSWVGGYCWPWRSVVWIRLTIKGTCIRRGI